MDMMKQFGNFAGGAADAAGDQMEEAGQAVGQAYHQSKNLICVGLLVFIGALGTGGWNEYRNVAVQRTISLAKDHHNKVSCSPLDPSMDGKLVHFSCDVSGQSTLGATTPGVPSGTTGFKLDVTTEVFRPERRTRKVKCPDANTDAKECDEVYYEKGWYTSWSQYSQAQDPQGVCDATPPSSDCDAPNRDPQQKSFWTSQSMSFGSKNINDFSSTAKIGDFKMPSNLLSKVWKGTPLTPSCTGNSSCPSGALVSGYYLIFRHDGSSRSTDDIGDVRQQFVKHDVSETKNSVLAEQTGDTVQSWTSPYDSDYDIYEAMSGELSPEDMFTSLEETNEGLTWFLRLFTLVLTMVGIFCVVSPISVMADLIPVIGDFISNVVDFFLGIFSCASGCMCWCFVAGVVWVVYRPYVGIPLLIVTLLACGGLAYWRVMHPDVGRDDNKTNIANGQPVAKPPNGMDFCPSCGGPKPAECSICNNCDKA